MSYHDPSQKVPDFHGSAFKSEEPNDASQSPDPDNQTQDKKPAKHRRNYQACEPCRERKVKCDLGDVDNPSSGPCKKCAREQKKCWFRETRKKEAGSAVAETAAATATANLVAVSSAKDVPRAAKRARTDSTHSNRTFEPLPPSPSQPGQRFSYPSNVSPLSPTRSYAPRTPPGGMPIQHNLANYSQPRSTPTHFPQQSTNRFAMPQSSVNMGGYNQNGATSTRLSNGDDHVVMPQANTLAESFTNTTDNMSVLVRAATTTEAGANSVGQHQRNRALTGGAGDVDLTTLPPQVAKTRQQAREVWSQMKLVRAGWFTADEALQYVEYFYIHLAPMTPVVIQDFRDPITHRKLLTEEPVLALAILAITSRYYELKTVAALSRNYYIHQKLWDSLRKIIERLLWGQEQFGGGFTGAGMVATQQSASGQITWKGSLRTLGTVEALLLLTDWQPRALHFPPGDDENKLVGASHDLLEDDRPRSAESGNMPYSTWLEPAWRSDRMSWMLLGLAQSLAFELGVFDRRHELCGRNHSPHSDCMWRRRLRRMIITYVVQISGRIGIQTSLSPEQDDDPSGPNASEPVDLMQKLWFDIASLMFSANRDIFPSRETTSALIESGEYKAEIDKLKPRLDQWLMNFKKIERSLDPAMRVVLKMEYQYSRLYINSLGLQKVVTQMAMQNRNTISRGLSAQLGPVYDENKDYIDEVRDAARQILELSCYGLGNMKALGYAPVRIFLRTLSGLMFSLKLFSLGNEERVVRSTFKLLREMIKRMSEQVADDVHLSPHTARLIAQLMEDVHNSMVRIPKASGSRGQSRHMSPEARVAPNSSTVSYSTISDQESPDPLGAIPFADYANQTFMPPPGFDTTSVYDANMTFDANVDPALAFHSGEDWISLPIDNILELDAPTVNQGYGGIGPTFGGRDMLSLITGTQLDQNQGFGEYGGSGGAFIGLGNGF